MRDLGKLAEDAAAAMVRWADAYRPAPTLKEPYRSDPDGPNGVGDETGAFEDQEP